MNSLGVSPFVNNLYQDLNDGLVLLQVKDIHFIVASITLDHIKSLSKLIEL